MIEDKLSLLTESSGCYIMKDKTETVIYIGKAKNLKNRVTSYFRGAHDLKTTKLVSLIVDFEYIVTNTELDALILELNLIKKYKPRFNIVFKDSKTYPYILLTNTKHPYIKVTRNINKKNGKYFGPYPNTKAARDTVKLLNSIYKLRKCNRIPKEACLYYYMDNCLAPCINKVDESKYIDIKKEITSFLNGNATKVLKELKEKMNKYSSSLEFEKALEYKNLIESINDTTAKTEINLNDNLDRDVIGYFNNDDYISIEIFYMRQGRIVAREHDIFEYIDKDIITSITEYLSSFYDVRNLPNEILIPKKLELLEDILPVKITVPLKGNKLRVVKLATKNAEESLLNKIELYNHKLDKTIGAVNSIGEMLNIDTPYIIEAFDNSHTFGTDIVSAMVVFVNGEPNYNSYRKYKITTVDKPDDYNSMKEVIYRRYYRVLLDNLTKPNLIVMDGGIGQVNVAKDVLNTLNLDIPICGIVKDDKHNTSHLINSEGVKFNISVRSHEFRLLTKIQDEAHRFAITYHKSLRQKGIYNSILDDIEGLGEVRKNKLLMKYKSVNNIYKASVQELIDEGIPENVVMSILNNNIDK